MKLSSKELHELLSYDPETGEFTWRVNRGGASYAGTKAGRVNRGTGYVEIGVKGTRERAHAIAWAMMTGAWADRQIDHINCQRSDNRWVNLRLASAHENARNAQRSAANKSGFKGASWKAKNRKWTAQISVENKKIYLGLFDTAEAAHAAYVEAARRLHGEFARAA